MADRKKKKAYRRFEELTKRAMVSGSAEAQGDRAPSDGQPGDDGAEKTLTETILISVSPEVSRALQLRAEADNTTSSDVVEAALRRYLEIRRSRFT
jgi:hypothetical protein